MFTKVDPNPLNLDGQAARIIAKFGTAGRLAKALDRLGVPEMARTRTVVYRWTYPKSRGGTGGLIPLEALPAVIAAAKLEGVLITPDDLYGRLG